MNWLKRKAPYISVTVIMLSLFGIFYLNAITLAQLKTQLANQQKIIQQIQNSGDQRSTQLKTLNDHIDCIVLLLSQPNRTQVTIESIQDCKLVAPPVNTSSPVRTAPQTPPGQKPAPETNKPTASPKKPAKQPANPPVKQNILDKIYNTLRDII